MTPQSPNQWVVLKTLHAHEMNGCHRYTELQILGDSNKVCISASSAFSPTIGPTLKPEEKLDFCKKTSACLAKPPVDERISGVKLACSRGVGTWGATGARAPLVLQQAKLTYKAYVGLSLRDPVGSADHMALGVCDAIGIATQYSYIIVRHYLEL